MELVSITAARAGQVLARAVTNPSGATVCPTGFRLTEAVIERLRNAGVETLLIEVDSAQKFAVQDRIEALGRRFANVDDPILLQIKATIENRLNLMGFESDPKP
jgi:hypothetical protein